MQQALLRKGSNRNTAVGGLKEAISGRCACASQNIEEGGGGNIGNQSGREGRGHTPRSRKRSVRGSRHMILYKRPKRTTQHMQQAQETSRDAQI